MSSNVSNQGRILACAIATWTIAAMFVGLRFFLRGHLMKVLGWEDWTILLSLIFSCAVSVSFIVEAHYGLGRHIDVLTAVEVANSSEAFWVSSLMFALTIYLTKFSVLFLYMRTLTHDWVQYTLRVLTTVVVLTLLADICLIFTQCIPLTAVWDSTVHASYCHAFSGYYVIVGIQIAADFLIFLLPLPVIWGMRAAPKNQKMMLFVLFSFGFFICIVSIVRLSEITAIRRNTDWTFESVTIHFWSLVQANTGIVCACVMTMKPLINRLIPGSGGGGTTRTKTKTKTRRGGLDRKTNSTPDHLRSSLDLFRPPTIGSKPSRSNTFPIAPTIAGAACVLSKKQSWFTAQLARLDRSLQTVTEAEHSENGTMRDNNSNILGALETGSGPSSRRPSLVAVFLAVPMRPHMPIPRLSHHSSIITTHAEQQEAEMDEVGPLEPARYARRSSCAV